MTLEATAPGANYGSTASGSSFYAAMRILPRDQREAMFQIYSFCRQVDDIADSDGPRDERLAALQQWRNDIDALYQGNPPPRLARLRRLGEDLRAEARGFPRHRRRHGDGRAAGHPRAGHGDARSLLRSRRQRRRTAVGAGVRPAGRGRHRSSPIISAARSSSPTSCATSTRTQASAGSICRARRCCMPASPPTIRTA